MPDKFNLNQIETMTMGSSLIRLEARAGMWRPGPARQVGGGTADQLSILLGRRPVAALSRRNAE
jgi:hypothetical protein